MSSRVRCDQGHWGGLCRDAAVEMSALGTLSPCPGCQAPRRYITSHYFPNIAESHEHELERVARLYTDQEANEGCYDPMLFLLRDRESGRKVVWPFYWVKVKVKDGSRKWHVGQFPPLLALDDFKKLLLILESPPCNLKAPGFSK